MGKPVKPSAYKQSDPRFVPTIDLHELLAIKALAAGNANEKQQHDVIDVIMHKLCEVNGTYFSDNGSNNAFVMGRRFVALELAKLIHLEMKESKND